jgi:hypothetical protein
MSQESEPALVRRFSAHAANDSRKHTHDVFGVSFEDAAFDFIDRWHPAPDEDGEIQVMLVEWETGERQCFRVDLVGGEAGFCD